MIRLKVFVRILRMVMVATVRMMMPMVLDEARSAPFAAIAIHADHPRSGLMLAREHEIYEDGKLTDVIR